MTERRRTALELRYKIARIVLSLKEKKLNAKQIAREMKIMGFIMGQRAVYRILDKNGKW